MKNEINIAIVDDHKLYRKGLAALIKQLSADFNVLAEFDHGKQLIDQIDEIIPAPDVLILDIDMPVMNGYETLAALQAKNVELPTLIVTMIDDEAALIRMIKLGARGYLSKEIEPEELRTAIIAVHTAGYHFNDKLTGRLVAHVQFGKHEEEITERDLAFVKLCCTELTYLEIADKMNLSPKTIDGYRAKLFERFGVKSRVGLVLLAFKRKWV